MPFTYRVTISNRQNKMIEDAIEVDSPGKTVEQYIADRMGVALKETSRRFPSPDILAKLEQVKALHNDLNAGESVDVAKV